MKIRKSKNIKRRRGQRKKLIVYEISFTFHTQNIYKKADQVNDNKKQFNSFFKRKKKPRLIQVIYKTGYSKSTVNRYSDKFDIVVPEYYYTTKTITAGVNSAGELADELTDNMISHNEEQKENYDLVWNTREIIVKFYY